MAKYRKVKRNVKIYQSNRSKKGKKVLAVLVVLLLAFLGYMSAGPILEQIDKMVASNNSSNTSDLTSDMTSDLTSDMTSDLTSDTTSDDTTSGDTDTDVDEVAPVNAFVVPQSDMMNTANWDSYFTSLADLGYNSVVVDLKDENGSIYYNTAVENAVPSKVANAVDLTMLSKAISDAGLEPIARINTLKDKTAHASKANSYQYLTSTGVTWYDNAVKLGGKPWLNPYMENARKYISDLCVEISNANFKTIFLDTIQFPDGQMLKINFINESTTKSNILNQLIDEVNLAIEGNGAVAIPQVKVTGYLGLDDSIYGGSPADFVGESVALTVDYDALLKATLPESYVGLTVAGNYEKVLDNIFDSVAASSDEIFIFSSESDSLELKSAMETAEIVNIISK